MAEPFGQREVEGLKLDERNPRLPEEAQGSSQSEILSIFYRYYDLDELASSYVSNGFFRNEGLIILDDGTVLEGNRRLAALKYLLHDNVAQEAGLPEYYGEQMPTEDALDSLRSVPVQVVDSRDKLMSYLGFRHIKGVISK